MSVRKNTHCVLIGINAEYLECKNIRTNARLCFELFGCSSPTGISSETILKHSDISEEELLDLIFKLNTDPRVDGLLVQLPLPGIDRPEQCN